MTTINDLKAGVRRFRTRVFPPLKEFFERIGEEQKPSILFITCIDSRIDTSMLCDTFPGEMFEERTPGNIIPPHDPNSSSGLSASIEFAVTNYKLTDIVICGHSNCGALDGALHPKKLEATPAVKKWLEPTVRLAEQLKRDFPEDSKAQRQQRLCEWNVVEQIADLKSHPSVKAKKPRIHGWTYEIRTGEVKAYDSARKAFLLWPAK